MCDRPDVMSEEEFRAKFMVPAPGTNLKYATDILSRLRLLRNEVECRIEHGADCGGHLSYVEGKLKSIIQDFSNA